MQARWAHCLRCDKKFVRACLDEDNLRPKSFLARRLLVRAAYDIASSDCGCDAYRCCCMQAEQVRSAIDAACGERRKPRGARYQPDRFVGRRGQKEGIMRSLTRSARLFLFVVLTTLIGPAGSLAEE